MYSLLDDSYRKAPDRAELFEITEISQITTKIIKSALMKMIPIAPIETNAPKTTANMATKIPNIAAIIPAITPNKTAPATMARAPSGISKINRNGANRSKKINFIA